MARQFGFVPTHRHPAKNVIRYQQYRINLTLTLPHGQRPLPLLT